MRTELYRFTEGGDVFTFTSADMPVTYNSEIYESIPIGRGNIVVVPELSKANLEVSMSLNLPLALRWLSTVIDKNIGLELFTTDGTTTTVTWQGRLSSVRTDGRSVILTMESVFTSLRRPGLRKRYQRTCPYALYGRGCFVDRNAFSVSGTVTAIDGLTITVAEAALQPDGYYAGGIVEETNGGVRFISTHVGDQITLARDLTGIEVSGVVKINPGCDRTRTVCNDRFNNLANFGGFPFIPTKNPFGGSSIV